MKIIVDSKETGQKEGLESLLGEKVVLLCMNYFYTGELIGVNDKEVKLKSPSIIYETGEWSSGTWKDAQKLGVEYCYVFMDKIETYFAVKK
jgi:hypothetical protein